MKRDFILHRKHGTGLSKCLDKHEHLRQSYEKRWSNYTPLSNNGR